MKQTFRRTGLIKQTLIVDDDGVHELRRDREVGFIPWEEIESVGENYVRDIRGRRIAMGLGEKANDKCNRCVSEIWRQRCPDHWLLDWKRRKRILQWGVYLWFPLLTFVPIILYYALLWILGWPKGMEEDLHTMNRVTILSVVIAIFLALFAAFYIRRTEKKIVSDKLGKCT